MLVHDLKRGWIYKAEPIEEPIAVMSDEELYGDLEIITDEEWAQIEKDMA